jgi:hypothetical protein
MQFTACRPAQPFLKRKYWKCYNDVYCLPASTAVSLNGNTESVTMQFTACRPAQPFLKTEILKVLQCSLLPAGQHRRFYKRKYWKTYNAVYWLPAQPFL